MDQATLMLASAVVVATLMTLLWLASLAVADASIADIAWGPVFVVLALVGALLGDGWLPRRILVLGLVGLWGLRLALHIGMRHRGSGEDPRYARWRAEHGRRWWWLSLFQVFLLQGAVLWVVSLPVQLAQSVGGPSRFTIWDTLGGLLWAGGFLVEVVADSQLRAFREDPERSGVLDRGLWSASRHPNYFGEAVLWWGIGLVAVSVPWGWASLVGPLLITLLLRYVSGVPLAERLMEGREGWDEYAARTPVFVPGPRRASGRIT